MANQRRQAAHEAPPEVAGAPLKILIGVGCFGVAVLLLYLSMAQPQQATAMAAIRNVMRGIAGSIHPVLALILVWVGVMLMMSAQGHPVRALNMVADGLLFLCLFTAVQLFSAQLILEQRMAITSYANFINQSYIFGAGGGVLGALLAYPLYIYLGGKWGGLIVVLMVALLCLLATGRLQRAYNWAATRLDEGQKEWEKKRSEREMEHIFETDDERRGPTRVRNADSAPRRRPPEKDYIVIEDPPRVSRVPSARRDRGDRGLANIELGEDLPPQGSRSHANQGRGDAFETRAAAKRDGNGADSIFDVAAQRNEGMRPQPDRTRGATVARGGDAGGGFGANGNMKRGGNGSDAARARTNAADPRRPAANVGGGIQNAERKSSERVDNSTESPSGPAKVPSIQELSEIANDVEMNLIADEGLDVNAPKLDIKPASKPEAPSEDAPARRPEPLAKPESDVPDFFTVHDDLPEEAPPAPEKSAARKVVVEGTRALEVDDIVPETLPEALRVEEEPPIAPPPRAQGERLPKPERRDGKADEKAAFQANDPEGEAEEEYFYPPIDLLTPGEQPRSQQAHRDADREKAEKLIETLRSFGIETRLIGIAHGPAVTRFELQPAPGVKVSRITALSDDIALGLAALSVRIEAPIPGKAAVGVEIPNDKVEMVRLRDVLECPEAQRHPSKIAVGLGKDNSGRYIIADIAKMPHVLIAGQTGSGKSVCINSIITSILYRAAPDEVRLILIDPKVVELSIYNDIPHLIAPVVTDPKKASSALDWAVAEMGTRYKRFAERDVRDIKGYNKKLEPGEKPMPQIVIIIDELADLMMVAPGEVEDSICRLAQLARAAGMHLVIATQRPSVNVITGIIKANIPTRIAFSVASQIDSRTMIDHGGAEKLLGNGDMLFVPSGINKPLRVQGAWVSDDEVHAIVSYIKARSETTYDEDVVEKIENSVRSDAEREEVADEYDPRLPEAVEIVVEAGQASTSMLQRRMRVGYARAGRLIDEMERRGVIGEADGSKPRNVLITREQFHELFGTELPASGAAIDP